MATSCTSDEFITWALEQPEGRFELSNGMVVAVPPDCIGHGRAKLRILHALQTSIALRGLGCEVHPDGAAVRIDGKTVYGPDALVRCGPPLPDDAIEITDPVIVVEVVSPFSKGIDRGVKLVGYFSLQSVRHCLIVDTNRQVIIHHWRNGDGEIEAKVRRGGLLTLEPPGLVIEVQDIFPPH